MFGFFLGVLTMVASAILQWKVYECVLLSLHCYFSRQELTGVLLFPFTGLVLADTTLPTNVSMPMETPSFLPSPSGGRYGSLHSLPLEKSSCS
jgi:hypothetical protein